MIKTFTSNRKKILTYFLCVLLMMAVLISRMFYIMVTKSEYYSNRASEVHERERSIKAARGKIIDRNGVILATNRTVCTISVIHSQITDPENVIKVLCDSLNLTEEEVRKKVEKNTSIEKIATNIDKEIGDIIRNYNLAGVKVDEDYKRYYPYDSLASKVLGFTGSDNQGIIGLEVAYDEYLEGSDGKILTVTDANGVEIEDMAKTRIEPVAGNDLYVSIDYNIQMYAEQLCTQAMEEHTAKSVSMIVMNPQNGEIYAMVNVPEFNLNNPYDVTSISSTDGLSTEDKMNLLNQIWRNGCINDTYEPGSTFKVITAAAALEAGVVTLEDTFSCPGYKMVEDRRIKCHKIAGHGSENFLQAVMNSCNPVFIELGLRLGGERYYSYFEKFGLLEKTGIDLPGEASTIMHKEENIGLVELATISFGQSFQITPIQLIATVSGIVNGGNKITPHFGVKTISSDKSKIIEFQYDVRENIITSETSELMQYILENVVSNGTGKNAYVEGFSVGGKTATSQKLPRGSGKYISSFIGFAPADDPKVIAMITIDEPVGTYYGGTIAAPVIKTLYENILPYMGFEKTAVVEEEN